MEETVSRIIEKKTLWEGKFLRFILTKYIDSSGTIREWESIERVNCKGIVVIVPLTDDGRIILTKQFRPPVNRYVVEFPAGLNEKGDSLEEVASRELLEETGYSAKEMVYIGEGPISSGASGEVLTAFLAKGLVFKGTRNRDETEDIEVFEIPIDQFYDKLSALRTEGNLIDLKIYGLLELAKRHL